ncbi:MAG: hypothetical protein E6R04_06940 [Spirochaetes bacterium]|nr:MAG: hypothetical protein E6R04_06940 [Spirochaetota bacterium]
MNASELADSLELRWADSNSTEEDEVILKSLSFAADMEKLLLRMPRFELWDGYVILSVYDDTPIRIQFDAPDIYSAARKAVEALVNEGG